MSLGQAQARGQNKLLRVASPASMRRQVELCISFASKPVHMSWLTGSKIGVAMQVLIARCVSLECAEAVSSSKSSRTQQIFQQIRDRQASQTQGEARQVTAAACTLPVMDHLKASRAHRWWSRDRDHI